MARYVLLAYPHFNETFKIHTNDRNLQLGTAISHNGEPVAFYSRKLTGDQMRYTWTEMEPLIIIKTSKYSITILLGQRLKIYIYH